MIDEKILAELKEKLLSQRVKLQEDLGKFAKPTENPENYETKYEDFGDDRDDNASEVESYSDNVALENNLESQLREVNDALDKMEKGKYGICENCNQEIDIERLEAYPSARTCIKCK